MDDQTQDTQETESTPKKRRNRMKSPRQQLHDSLRQFDEMLNNPNLKETKKAEVLIERASIQKMLWQAERGDDKDAAILENETLKTQHEKDTGEIERLRAIPTRREVITIQDEESPRLRQQVAEQQKVIESLQSFIKFLASEFSGDKPKTAIAVILRFGRDCKEYVTALGIDFDSYFRNLNNQHAMTEANLRASVDPPEDEHIHNFLNRPMVSVEFAIAALAVCYQIAIKAPVRKVNGVPRSYASLCPKNLFDDD